MVEYHLKILGQDDSTERLIDLKNGFSIGTAGTNDLCLKTQGMEPKHCTFRLHNEILSVYNHDTGGQTSIDNFPLKPGKSYIVDQGDTIIIGDVKFKVYKNLGAMKDENVGLETSAPAAGVDLSDDIELEDDVELEMDDDIDIEVDEDLDIEIDETADSPAKPEPKLTTENTTTNAVDESLDEYDEDMFEMDPTQMTIIADDLPPQEMVYKKPESPVAMAQSNPGDDEDLDIELDDDMDLEMDLETDLEMDLNDDEDIHEIVNDVAQSTQPKKANAVDESLEDYDDDLFDNVDPTKMQQVPEEFKPAKSPEALAKSDDELSEGLDDFADAAPTTMAQMPPKETDEEDLDEPVNISADPFEELNNEIAFQDAAPTAMAQIPDEIKQKIEQARIERENPKDYNPFGLDQDQADEEEEDDLFANVDPTRMDNLPDEFRPVNREEQLSSLDDDLDDEFDNAEPTMMAKIPDLLNQQEQENTPSEEEEVEQDASADEDLISEDDLISEADLEEVTDEIELPQEIQEANNSQPEAQSELPKEPTSTNSRITQLGAGVETPVLEGSSEDVFKTFEFVDDASGLLGSKDVERIKKEAIDKMSTEMSGINILPIDEMEEEEEEEVDFSFGDEGAGLKQIYTPENPPPKKEETVQAPVDEEPKTKSFVKDFEMSTTLVERQLNDEDTEDFSGGDGSYNTGVIDLGQEKTKILDVRKEKGEDLFPGEDQTMDKIGVDPLPPVSEFRPDKDGSVDEPLSVEEALLSAKQVNPDDEKSKKPGLFSKIKGLFKRSDDDDDEWDEEDDDWDDDDDDLDDDDDDEDDEDDEGFGNESSLTGVTDMMINFLQLQKDDAKKKKDGDIAAPDESSDPEPKKKEKKEAKKDNKKKPDLKLVKNEEPSGEQTMIQKAQAQGMGLDLSEDDLDIDENKDYVIEEGADSGGDSSVTNIDIGELNEKLKALEEEGREVQKKGFFQGLFGKKDKSNESSDDEELEFDEDDGEDDFDDQIKAQAENSENIVEDGADATQVGSVNEEDEEFSVDVPKNLKEKPASEDEATDPGKEDEPTDPGIDNEPTDPAGVVITTKEDDDEEKADLKAAPSLVKGAKKGKRKSKFTHGPFPWVLGRAYAFLSSVIITKLTYDIVLSFLELEQKYLEIVQKVFTPLEKYLQMYQEYYSMGLEEIPKHIKQIEPYFNKVPWENILTKITDFEFFKYVLLFIIIESVSAFMLGTSIPKFLMGIKSTDGYPKSTIKHIFMTIFGVLTMPLVVLDLPILFRMRSVKELLTRTELYYRSKIQMIAAPFFIIPGLFVIWYLSPFANLNLITLPQIESSSSIQLKASEENGITEFESEALALKGTYTKNDKFAYLPVFGKGGEMTITFVDSFLKESASMSVGKIVDAKEMTTELMEAFPEMKYVYKEGMNFSQFKNFVEIGMQMSLDNPISLLEPLKMQNPFSNAYVYQQQKLIKHFEIDSPLAVSKQSFGSDMLIYTFKLPKQGISNIDSYLSIGKLDVREFKLSYEGKVNKAKNRLIRNFLGAKSTMVHVDNDLSSFNAFNAFDMIKAFKSSGDAPLSLRESAKAFYYIKAKEVVVEDNATLRKPLIRSLKSLLAELNSIDSQKAKELSSELDKTLQALDKLNKDYFSKSLKSSSWKKSTQSVKKSSTKVKNSRKKSKSKSKRRR